MPKFRKTEEELSSHLDYWLYYLNNLADTTKIPEILKQDELIEEAFSVAEFLALDKDEQFEYQQDLKARWDNKACLDFAKETAMEKGMEKGMEQGEKKAKIKIAKNLLLANMDIKFISETTGLDQKTIEGLK
jgi:predicted transposase/invertase (TIGR01784 family)